ncbi:E3 ubiquitin-protein ligase TRIM71-like isoform X2 [Dysidea avara]|uniref:E3 ubiquitin-protein ligase TRIM71-like isoform X2 n=1 Tax=Dysidea avara TaxID=196820 RepID=UPI00332A4124
MADVWDKVREQIVCAICYGLLNDPKTLPCLHTYCSGCCSESHDKRITVCRKSITLNENGVESLPTNFTISNLVDVMKLQEQAEKVDNVKCGSCNEDGSPEIVAFCYNCKEFLCQDCARCHKKMKTLQQHNCVSLEELKSLKSLNALEKPEFCRQHPEKKVKLFCLTCQVLICKDCVLVLHKDHSYNFIDTVSKDERSVLAKALESLSANLEAITMKITIAEQERTKTETLCYNDVAKLKESVEQAIKLLSDRAEMLEADIKQNFQMAIGPLQTYKDTLKLTEGRMQECLKFGQQLLQQPSDREVLGLKLQVMSRITELNDAYQECLNTNSHQIEELPKMKNLKLPSSKGIEEFCSSFGEFRVMDSLDNCVADGAGIQRAYKSKEAHFTITLKDSKGQTVTNLPHAYIVVQLTCLANNYLIECQLTHKQNGVITVSYTPVNLGEHHVTITVEGSPFPGSPFLVNVLPPYENFGVKYHELTDYGEGKKFGEMWGLAINSFGDIAISDTTNKCIIVLDNNYNFERVISGPGKADGELQYPLGIVYTTKDTLLVVDGYHSKVQEFDVDGKYLTKFGGPKGSEDGQFIKPTGITIDKNAAVYVVDKGNYRVQVFQSGSFVHKFGTKGSGKGQFEEPYDIAVDNFAEQIFVTDRKLNRIQAFNMEGEFISSFTDRGNLGSLRCPNCLALDSDSFVIVSEFPSDKHHRVSIFSPQLNEFVISYGESPSVINCPFSIGVTKNGDIIVVGYNRRVLIFEL